MFYFFRFPDENAPGFEGRKKKFKIKKKYKKFILPLLIAYKLKFFALIPIMISGLILLLGSTGLAGFFFALFVAVISLKGGHSHWTLESLFLSPSERVSFSLRREGEKRTEFHIKDRNLIMYRAILNTPWHIHTHIKKYNLFLFRIYFRILSFHFVKCCFSWTWFNDDVLFLEIERKPLKQNNTEMTHSATLIYLNYTRL